MARLFHLFLLLGLAAPAARASESGKLFSQAEDLLLQDETAAAQKLYVEIRERFPGTRAAAYSGYRLGAIYLGRGDLTAAEEQLSEVKETSVSNDVFIDASIALVATRVRAEKFDAAEAVMSRLIDLADLNPARSREIFAFGFRVDARAGKFARAVEMYDRWLSLPETAVVAENEKLSAEELGIVVDKIPADARVPLRVKVANAEVKARLDGRAPAQLTEESATLRERTPGWKAGGAIALGSTSFSATDRLNDGTATFNAFPSVGLALTGEIPVADRWRAAGSLGVDLLKVAGPTTLTLSSTSASLLHAGVEARYFLDAGKLWDLAIGLGLGQSLFFEAPTPKQITLGKQTAPYASIAVTRALGQVAKLSTDARAEVGANTYGHFFGLGVGAGSALSTTIEGRVELNFRSRTFTNDAVAVRANEIGLRISALWLD